MKKRSRIVVTLFSALAILFSIHAKGQTAARQLDLFLGISAGLPTGTATIGTVFNLGGDIRLQYGLSNNFALTFTTGGYHFFPALIPGTNTRYGSYGIGPIKIGGKYFFNAHYYFGLEAGIGVEVTEDGFDGQNKFLLAPAVGYTMDRWDFGLRYENYSGQNNTYGQVAVRAAYAFRLSKK